MELSTFSVIILINACKWHKATKWYEFEASLKKKRTIKGSGGAKKGRFLA
jgi:hypothetical protein